MEGPSTAQYPVNHIESLVHERRFRIRNAPEEDPISYEVRRDFSEIYFGGGSC